MTFLIQTYNGVVEHDFSLELIESIKYLKWIDSTNDMNYVLSDDINDYGIGYIPIGSVEFVQQYLKTYHNINVKPINIPNELFPFCERTIINGTEKDINGTKFVKSNDKIKYYTEITKIAPPGNYQISDIIDIKSEWRSFVYKNKLVGLQNYSGDFKIFPDIEKIETIINNYKSAPIAYTLDVAILTNNKTDIIEIHDFFSCGLYGFSDRKILPYMFIRWFNDKIK
jgi:hypothetical protein